MRVWESRLRGEIAVAAESAALVHSLHVCLQEKVPDEVGNDEDGEYLNPGHGRAGTYRAALPNRLLMRDLQARGRGSATVVYWPAEAPDLTVATTGNKQERVIVRFAGDSGDGMQLVGGRFTAATAQVGNDLSTLPDFPAEIRAPAGTPHGVSAFQIHFASRDILTPGDHPNTLVAMNPAALKSNLAALESGGTLIVNEDAFTDNNLRKAGYEQNPLDDGTLDGYQVFRVPMTSIATRAPPRRSRG